MLIYKSSNRAIFVQPRKNEHKTNQFFNLKSGFDMWRASKHPEENRIQLEVGA
jgi:hypothetical protein